MSSRTLNNPASWIARLKIDEQSGRRLSVELSESSELTHAAVSLVDNGRGQWQVVIHFGAIPDQRKIRTLVSRIHGPDAGKRLHFERLSRQDWVKASLEGLSLVHAGRLLVHGAHDRARVPPNRIGIEIEAGLAFGTGHHGTTRGCLLALDGLSKSLGKRPGVSSVRKSAGRRVLDLGTGSGVLAIAAAKVLRQRVLATDIDAGVIRVARANARLNRAGAMVEVLHADGLASHRLHAGPPFDLIFANILLAPLQRLAAPVINMTAPGARVILSGLLTSQANAAIAAYRPLALERRIEVEGWTTLVLARHIRPRHAVARLRRGS
jgi:ribosomal protein L11 methyltransferase